jgi:hypothetical protein
MAGPETLGALRSLVGNRLQQSEVPSSLADPQANQFVTPRPSTQTPTASQVASPPGPGATRVGGTDDRANRDRLDAALRQQQLAAGAREPMTDGERAHEEAAALANRPPPSQGELIRRAGADRATLAQRQNELRRMQSEPPANPDPTWNTRAQRLQREIEGLQGVLANNPENARFDQLESARRDLAEAQRLGRGWAGSGRSRPESDRRIAAAQERFNTLASQLGYLP